MPKVVKEEMLMGILTLIAVMAYDHLFKGDGVITTAEHTTKLHLLCIGSPRKPDSLSYVHMFIRGINPFHEFHASIEVDGG